MGNPLFGVDIAGIIHEHISPGVLTVTITREESTGQRQAGNLTGGTVKKPPETWECAGFWEDFTGTPPPGVEIELNDRKLVLIGDSIPPGGVPCKNDAATIVEERGSTTLFVVQLLERDPAAAVYKFLCRDRRGPDRV